MTRKNPVCATCGSSNVLRDAWAEWDHARQCWELGETFDNAFCADCDGETSIEWKAGDTETDGGELEPLTPEEIDALCKRINGGG